MTPTDTLRRAFRDIAAGHTRAAILGRPAFIKHLTHMDQVDLDERREEFYQQARQGGLPTEAEKLDILRKWGEWSDERDREIAQAREYLNSLIEGKEKQAIKFPSMVKEYMRKIADAEKDLREREQKKRELLGLTCEYFSNRELNDHYILKNLYADPALKTALFSEDEFEYLSEKELGGVVTDYNAAMESCSDRNLKLLAIQPFFQRQFQIVGESLRDFFGRPICDLTNLQVDLLRYAVHFRNIYANHDVSQFPKEVQENPDMLTEYANSATKAKDQLTKNGAYEEGAMVVGMKPEDAKATGIKTANPLAEIATKFGGNGMKWAESLGR